MERTGTQETIVISCSFTELNRDAAPIATKIPLFWLRTTLKTLTCQANRVPVYAYVWWHLSSPRQLSEGRPDSDRRLHLNEFTLKSAVHTSVSKRVYKGFFLFFSIVYLRLTAWTGDHRICCVWV